VNEHDLLCEILDTTEAFLDTEPIPTGPRAKELVALLRQQITNLQQYRLHGNEADRPPVGAKTKLCERCKTPFFFARDAIRVRFANNEVEKPWQRKQGWAPFELDPISAKGVTANFRYVIDFNGPYPMFHVEPTRDSGQVWVDHRETCGTGNGPQVRCSPYLRRYKVNQERANLEVESWKDDLQALQRRLNQ
jgi:hypothetical protein